MKDNLPDDSITLQRFLPTGFLYNNLVLFVFKLITAESNTFAGYYNLHHVGLVRFYCFEAHILGASLWTPLYSRQRYSLDLKQGP